ncbi:hypothetical protein EDC04DRAFT_2914533 [Pisolithus marmoratus]|nr:hypothetical protein EDC04DRAFT_2914533 [Pisolithus marmoratus]
MSQNIANTSLPTPTTTQDWTAVLEEAIQSASDDDKETANAKYAESHEKVEAECQEQECQEKEEHVYTVDLETKFYEALSN